MRTTSLTLLAAIVGACQAFTGTGDLEVRETGSTTSGAGPGGSSTSASASGATGGHGGGGAGGAGGISSAASSMMSASQAASSSSGMTCLGCLDAFVKNDKSLMCSGNVTGMAAFDALGACACRECHTSNMTDPCIELCSLGVPPDDNCTQCLTDSCGSEYTTCQNLNR